MSTKSITLSELASGRQPERLIDEIGQMELTANELIAWEESKPRFRLVATDRRISIELHLSIPTRKTIAVLSGIIAFLWAFGSSLIQYLPALQSLLLTGKPHP